MRAFGRLIGAFGLMMVIGYVAVVALLPAPAVSDWKPGASGTAERLAQEAQALVTRKPASSIQ